MSRANLPAFNRRVREWVDAQPKKYHNSLKAFAYRCDTDTLSVTMPIAEIARQARKSHINVSHRTLNTHLKVFEASGMIKVTRHRHGERQAASTYTLNLEAGYDPWSEPAKSQADLHSGIPDDEQAKQGVW